MSAFRQVQRGWAKAASQLAPHAGEGLLLGSSLRGCPAAFAYSEDCNRHWAAGHMAPLLPAKSDWQIACGHYDTRH